MKLYTEEQIKEAIKLARVHKPNDFITWFHNYDDDIIDSLTPIELPSDEEIETEAEDIYPINVGGDMWMANRDEVNKGYKQEGFIDGAKWVIEHIKQQDNA